MEDNRLFIMAEVAAMDNEAIAKHLRKYARSLEIEGGNLMRVRAYRNAAQIIEELDEPLLAIWSHCGSQGLQALPLIGAHIANTIDSLLRSGVLPPHAEQRKLPGNGNSRMPAHAG
jgi:DNA polymerase/3'-5' exonuclease PolX